jgi:hypothetical protein
MVIARIAMRLVSPGSSNKGEYQWNSAPHGKQQCMRLMDHI